MITVIDYGMGNLSSVANAVKKYTTDVRISSEPGGIETADKIILPGVGAFKSAYEELDGRGLIEPILNFIKANKPFLGLCLGLQLLFTKSYEGGEHKGLGIIEGEVAAFPNSKGLKVPHMGWNGITQSARCKAGGHPLFKGVADGAYMYFVHSYYVMPKDKSVIATTTDYALTFCSSIWKGNIYAMQFHPEKSQKDGLKIIENFVRL